MNHINDLSIYSLSTIQIPTITTKTTIKTKMKMYMITVIIIIIIKKNIKMTKVIPQTMTYIPTVGVNMALL
jgi:hypothetical protein